MKRTNVKTFILIVICLFLFVLAIFVPLRFALPGARAYSYSDIRLEDGQTYYIKNERSRLYLDVKGASTANGAILQQYDWNGTNAQRFRLKNISGDIYEIIPLHAPSKRLEVRNNSNTNEAAIQINEANSQTNQRFKIVIADSAPGDFVIYTQTSNFTKCLTVHYASYNSGTDIIQYNYYNDGSTDNDHWFFEKCTTLTLDETQRNYIGTDCAYTYDLVFPGKFQQVDYYIKLSTLTGDPVLELYQNNTLLASQNNTSAKIVFKPASATGYKIKVKMYANTWGICDVTIHPVNEVHFNSSEAADEGKGLINTLSDVEDSKVHLNKFNTYVYNEFNSQGYDMWRVGANGRTLFDNQFYMFSGHGQKMGSLVFAPDNLIEPGMMPQMTNCKLAVIAACYSGDAYNSAQWLVEDKGVRASIGWANAINNDTAHTFVTAFWDILSQGYSISAAVEETKAHLSRFYWWKNLFGWGDDDIVNPLIFGDSSQVFATTRSAYASLKSANVEIATETELETFLTNNDVQIYCDPLNPEITRYIKKMNGLITNEYFLKDSVTGCVYKSKYCVSEIPDMKASSSSIFELFNYSNGIDFEVTLKTAFYISDGSKTRLINRYQLKCYREENWLDERYFDVHTGEEIDAGEIEKYYE